MKTTPIDRRPERPATTALPVPRGGRRVTGAVRRPGRRDVPVLVVAPPAERAAIARSARRHGREVVAVVDPAELAAGAAAFAVPDGVFDVAVHAAGFDAVRDQAPSLLGRAREVRLAGRFDDPAIDATVEVHDPWQQVGSAQWAGAHRALDVLLGSIALVLTLPVVVVAAAAIRLESPGSPLYRQTRVGRHGRRFTLYKLRTMHAGTSDAEHRRYVAALVRGEAPPVDGVFKLVHDPRITRVGAVLRRFSIDELPQLWNVVRGEMSLVGPRPELPSTLAQCPGLVWTRLRVRPGLTGLWQVSGRCVLPFAEMVALDIRYCEHVGPALDLAILARTPRAVFRGTGSA